MSISKKPARPEIISLRVNEERMQLLERHREALAAQLGRPISLSEAVFLLIDDRASDADRQTMLYELRRTPTAALDAIRKQWTAARGLAPAQWDLLAEYVQIGAEEDRQVPPLLQPAVPSQESYVALLDAFAAVYQQRSAKTSRQAWLYFSNLDGYHSNVQFSDSDHDQQHDAVMRLIAHRRARLTRTTEPWEFPGNVGASLVVAIRDEGIDSTRLDQALAPYWPVLWGLAARGHWIRHDHQPVRIAGPHDEGGRRFLVPAPAALGDMRLSFDSAGPELAMEVWFDGQRRFMAAILRYPELMEFRAMLEATAERPWRGRHFAATLWQAGTPSTRTVWLRRDLAIDFTKTEWTTLRDLVRQAWASPALQHCLQDLAQEYGEHG